ncbi:hypothetical protein IFM89_028861 [Coptis chinensis]|uniref:Uncharacterized protein n=1 Tax=Coptis chinensis TaxID=261450 RepID=A0A835LJS4_9MAGN|nr:hypothetical protein IFM89_028861 [Coptis chinensis]
MWQSKSFPPKFGKGDGIVLLGFPPKFGKGDEQNPNDTFVEIHEEGNEPEAIENNPTDTFVEILHEGIEAEAVDINPTRSDDNNPTTSTFEAGSSSNVKRRGAREVDIDQIDAEDEYYSDSSEDEDYMPEENEINEPDDVAPIGGRGSEEAGADEASTTNVAPRGRDTRGRGIGSGEACDDEASTTNVAPRGRGGKGTRGRVRGPIGRGRGGKRTRGRVRGPRGRGRGPTNVVAPVEIPLSGSQPPMAQTQHYGLMLVFVIILDV